MEERIMAITKYSYTKQVEIVNLKSEIESSTITIALDHLSANNTDVDIYFKAAISTGEETELTTIVNNHIYVADLYERETIRTKVVEELTETGGHFAATVVGVTSNTVGWHYQDYTWPIPISFLSAEYNSEDEHRGDKVEAVVSPDTIIGAITGNVSASDVVINVQQSVIDNVDIGFWVSITDGVSLDDLGRVVAIDDINNQVTVEIAATQSFLASSPTYFRMSIKIMHEFDLYSPGPIAIGESKIGGSYVTANTTLRIRYYNADGAQKTFNGAIDYLY